MSDLTLLAPLFAHVTLVFWLLMRLGHGRVSTSRAGQVRLRDVALSNDGWPEQNRKIANNYRNQFELPVLFYAVVILVIVTGTNGPILVALAWTFVGARIVHSLIHTGSNRVLHRFYAFISNVVIMEAMWIVFAAKVIMAE